MKETFERNYKYSYRIFSLYKSITEEDRAFIWRIELSTRNRQFPKIAKCPLCANPHRHSQISPRDNPDNERGKVKKQSGTVVSLKPEAAVTSHLRPCPRSISYSLLILLAHPPIPSTRFIPRAKPGNSAPQKGEGGNRPKGRGGWLHVHPRWIYTPFNPV